MVYITQSAIDALNYRIKMEEESSRLYLAMSTWLNKNGYMGAATLWKKYSDEEQEHAEWAYDYLLNLDVQPTVPELSEQQQKFNSLPEIIRLTLEHELDVTSQCNDLAKLAVDEGDFMLLELALKYVREQNEELGKATGWVDELEAFGEDPIALRLLDTKMGTL
jgi:ferritin